MAKRRQPLQWNGAVAIVTGASRGIGRAVARAAAARGASVGLIARSGGELATLRDEIGGGGAAAVADVGSYDDVLGAVSALTAALGPPDILVNNAGIGAYGAFAEVDPALVEHLVRVNFLGTVHATRAVLPGMIERRRGHVVVVGSIAGRIGAPFEAGYSATKFAQVGLTEALAVEVDPFGIGVSLVNPGPVATDFFEARGHPYDRARPRPVNPDQVAQAIIAAVEDDIPEQFTPRWLGTASAIRHVVPALFRAGTRRSFAEELEQEARTR